MKCPPIEREHGIVSAVHRYSGADALKDKEEKCGANKRDELQKHKQQHHWREGPRGVDYKNEYN